MSTKPMSIRLCPTSQESFVTMHSSVEYGLSTKPLFNKANAGLKPSKLAPNKLVSNKPAPKSEPPRVEILSTDSTDSSEFWGALVDLLPEGVIVVAPNMRLVHLNLKARELCQQLTQNDCELSILPSALAEICHRLIRKSGSEEHVLIVESETSTGLRLRIRARWFNPKPAHGENASPVNRQFILLLIESHNEVLQEELWIERRKYDLTEREAEIWLLLRQEYSYQEIAEALRISLNTVKTHIKNVYAKRRSHQGQDRLLMF
ncbi:LuxR C-terminal-related transcriptional regulator [Leptolyngbya sp. FACHB-541]|uniref:helix-turn-helix transcriptional regulator n=1 Tax=Leptolyngbya sp. FACHB-541 TaxID=2692810 RepID=UPI0018EFA9BC|nr:LuxR C-terminal-related transcriptional regulator [Leptolyngbya sp. FACHB-541]